MKINAPHKVRIGPRNFKIVYKDSLLSKDKEELSGGCHQASDLIEISLTQNRDKDMLFSTIFHEFLHGVWYVSGQTSRFVEDQEEDLTVLMESYLESMIDWSNPIWTNWKDVNLNYKKDDS